jgi:hypothetical protein
LLSSLNSLKHLLRELNVEKQLPAIRERKYNQ